MNIPNTQFVINFEDNDLQKYTKQLLIQPNNNYDAAKLTEWLQESAKLEHDHLFKKIILLAVSNYCNNIEVPDIITLYSLLFPTADECYRSSGRVGVLKSYKQRFDRILEEYYNIGMESSELDPHQLQQLVNYCYLIHDDNKIIINFICYLLYERIHPHHDGNGRMGRLLFIENAYQPWSYSLSKTLRKNHQASKLMDEIFAENNATTLDFHDYYTINVSIRMLENIVKLINIAVNDN